VTPTWVLVADKTSPLSLAMGAGRTDLQNLTDQFIPSFISRHLTSYSHLTKI
jgi:hypothetical protein